MSSTAVTESGVNCVQMPNDSMVPASMFAPAGRGCGDDADDECFEDGEAINGEVGDHGLDFSSKVGLWCKSTS